MTELFKKVNEAYENKTLRVITHKNCPDGMGSAWAISTALAITPSELAPFVEFVQYGDAIDFEQYGGCFVLFTDFSLKRDEMKKMIEAAKEVVVLDHHASAEKELDGLPNIIFDMNESGATITWKALMGMSDIPICLQYIKDRDLWLFKLPDTHAFTEGFRKEVDMNDLSSLDRFSVYDVTPFITEATTERIAYKNELVDSITKPENITVVSFGGVEIPTLNNRMFISEVGNLVSERWEHNICAQWFIATNNEGIREIIVSLRSIGDVDVFELARKFGGGGHKHASGFRLPLTDISNLVVHKRVLTEEQTERQMKMIHDSITEAVSQPIDFKLGDIVHVKGAEDCYYKIDNIVEDGENTLYDGKPNYSFYKSELELIRRG